MENEKEISAPTWIKLFQPQGVEILTYPLYMLMPSAFKEQCVAKEDRMRRIYYELMRVYPIGDGFSYDDFCYCVKELKEACVKNPDDQTIKNWVSIEIEKLIAGNKI